MIEDKEKTRHTAYSFIGRDVYMELENKIVHLVKEKGRKTGEIDRINYVVEGMYAGIDEVGVSSIAGSMVCSVVILPYEHGMERLPVDSKVLSEQSIQELSQCIEEKAIYYGIFAISAGDVDKKVKEIGMLKLQKRMWKEAILQVRKSFPDIPIVLDGKHTVEGVSNVKGIVGADDIYDSVSASAIISKHWCDEEIRTESQKYPEYLLAKHKGYPTKEHLESIRKYGMTPFHRVEMATEALNKPMDTRTYSLSEMEKSLRKVGEYLKEDSSLANESTLPFLREMWKTVIQNKTLPSEKQQRFAMNVCKSISKNHKRKIKKQTS
jgi:ribonuclease HII